LYGSDERIKIKSSLIGTSSDYFVTYEGVVKYIAPKDVPLAHLWLVVMGAPTEHWMNPISGEKDAQWPYKIKITGSFLLTSAN